MVPRYRRSVEGALSKNGTERSDGEPNGSGELAKHWSSILTGEIVLLV